MPAWVFVIGESDALRWVLSEQRMAFRQHVNTGELSPGDPVVIYATRGCWHNPTRDRAQVAAMGHIASKVHKKAAEVAGEVMVSSCRLALEIILPERQGVPFNDLVEKLQLTRSRATWGPIMRRTIVPLSDRDVKIIRTAVSKAVQAARAVPGAPGARSLV